jgi:hypothetical protein
MPIAREDRAHKEHVMVAQADPDRKYPLASMARGIRAARDTVSGKTPKGFEWIDQLSHAHQRQFAVELYRALAELNVSRNPDCIVELFEAWEATAELDVAPEVVEFINRPEEKKRYVRWGGTSG